MSMVKGMILAIGTDEKMIPSKSGWLVPGKSDVRPGEFFKNMSRAWNFSVTSEDCLSTMLKNRKNVQNWRTENAERKVLALYKDSVSSCTLDRGLAALLRIWKLLLIDCVVNLKYYVLLCFYRQWLRSTARRLLEENVT
ncbi:homeobox protein Hox-B3a isoform X2 [Chiloscyllium punctatum]|uniref:homeobox protein Hox-B3a isoform X2 n=1 Tax=Chiloscyllium punctatum TaxID=137246 RepID=UPI003B6366CD